MPHANITLRFLAEPSTVNFGGKVHGGTVMKWIDEAGYVCASAWSGLYCVTASVGNIDFIKPISIGDLVEVEASILSTGKSSMKIKVEVRSASPKHCEYTKTTACEIIFVALNEQGKPTTVKSYGTPSNS